MTMSPCCIWLARSCTVAPTAAAGTINQTTRGGFSMAMKSSSEAAPVAPLLAKSLTLSGFVSKTTHSWPPCNRRLAILAPILPKPDLPRLHAPPPPPIHCCRRHQCAYPRKLAQSRQTSLEQVLSQFALPPSNRPGPVRFHPTGQGYES